MRLVRCFGVLCCGVRPCFGINYLLHVRGMCVDCVHDMHGRAIIEGGALAPPENSNIYIYIIIYISHMLTVCPLRS